MKDSKKPPNKWKLHFTRAEYDKSLKEFDEKYIQPAIEELAKLPMWKIKQLTRPRRKKR